MINCNRLADEAGFGLQSAARGRAEWEPAVGDAQLGRHRPADPPFATQLGMRARGGRPGPPDMLVNVRPTW
jgi:hypothetical protein